MVDQLILQWTFLTETSVGRSAPEFRVMTNHTRPVIALTAGTKQVSFESDDCGYLGLDYFSKTENDTVTDATGRIVKDTMWRIAKIWCDGIMLEDWFINDAVYRPRYFSGYLAQFPDAPEIIRSPYQFNFPGAITWTWSGKNFWDWYFAEKNQREVIHHLDKDPERVWKFRGSLDPCQDLVDGIKDILKI